MLFPLYSGFVRVLSAVTAIVTICLMAYIRLGGDRHNNVSGDRDGSGHVPDIRHQLEFRHVFWRCGELTSTTTVTCTNTTPYNVGFNAGTAPGATVTTRKMTGPGGALLAYALYQDAAHTINWGNTIGTDTETGTGNGSGQTLTVYGQAGGRPICHARRLRRYDHGDYHLLTPASPAG